MEPFHCLSLALAGWISVYGSHLLLILKATIRPEPLRAKGLNRADRGHRHIHARF